MKLDIKFITKGKLSERSETVLVTNKLVINYITLSLQASNEGRGNAEEHCTLVLRCISRDTLRCTQDE